MCEYDLSIEMNPKYLVDILRLAYDMSRVEHEDWQRDFVPGPLPDEILQNLLIRPHSPNGFGYGTILGRGVHLHLFFNRFGHVLMHRRWKNHSPSQVNRMALSFGILGE